MTILPGTQHDTHAHLALLDPQRVPSWSPPGIGGCLHPSPPPADRNTQQVRSGNVTAGCPKHASVCTLCLTWFSGLRSWPGGEVRFREKASSVMITTLGAVRDGVFLLEDLMDHAQAPPPSPNQPTAQAREGLRAAAYLVQGRQLHVLVASNKRLKAVSELSGRAKDVDEVDDRPAVVVDLTPDLPAAAEAAPATAAPPLLSTANMSVRPLLHHITTRRPHSPP